MSAACRWSPASPPGDNRVARGWLRRRRVFRILRMPRISAGLLPEHLTWQRNEPGLFVQRPRDAGASRGVNFSIPARGERRCQRRGAIGRIRVIRCIRTSLRLWGRPSRVRHLRKRGAAETAERLKPISRWSGSRMPPDARRSGSISSPRGQPACPRTPRARRRDPRPDRGR